jgi:hypothetical protein
MLAAVTMAAMAVPRIELDLSGIAEAQKVSTIHRSHDLGRVQPNGEAVVSRQDWTERCPAAASTTEANCPFPIAKAFDHQDKKVKVTERVFLVDVNGNTCKGTAMDHNDCKQLCNAAVNSHLDNCQVTSITFSERSTYLFKYDAKDAAGNHAEQVVFALILDDETAPTLTMCGGEAETVEAASTWKLCASSTADDNIDVDISHRIKYKVRNMANTAMTCSSSNKDRACADRALLTKEVGSYLVTFKVCDEAGVYGVDGTNNCVETHKAVEIKDTMAPIIKLKQDSIVEHECATKYIDAGVDVVDLLDTEKLNRNLGVAPYLETTNIVDATAVNDYTVTYNAHDYAGNVAEAQVRKVEVRDTTAPVVVRHGQAAVKHYSCDPAHPTRDATHVQHDTNHVQKQCPKSWPADPEGSVTCTDSCGKDFKPVTLKPVRTWSPPFNEREVGVYTRTYTCTDAQGNAASTTRAFEVVDTDSPVIQIMGSDDETFDATNKQEYTDKGATCEDYVDGVLSHAVEVSGQVVNMRVPGVYTIDYDCQDLSQNAATQQHRKVTIKDTTCPVVTLKGKETMYIEAEFPFVDPGAAALDDLDGDITSKIWTDGDTVNSSKSFYSRRSCKEIKAKSPAAKTGEYFITTYVKESLAYKRQRVHCDMHSKNANGKKIGFTYFACKGCERVVPYGAAQGDCESRGLKMATFGAGNAKSKAWAMKESSPFGAAFFPKDAAATTDTYLCTTTETSGLSNAETSHSQGITHDKIERAETGKYVIFYHVQDSSGNAECSSPSRTVVVRDTLPPVITLHLRKNLIHTSQDGQKGLGGQVNPAGFKSENPFLKNAPTSVTQNSFMAEGSASSVNGWVLGAVASAVTGLALLSMSARKATTSIAV